MTTANGTPGWAIGHVGLCVHDTDAAWTFYEGVVGLAPTHASSRRPGAATVATDNGAQSASFYSAVPGFARDRQCLHNPRVMKFVSIEVDDLDGVASRLAKLGVPCSEIVIPERDDAVQLFCFDPSMNLIGFGRHAPAGVASAGDPAWLIHHVNLQAHDVRDTIGFFTGVADMREGTWMAPPEMGDFSIDPKQLAVLTLGSDNRGLHIIRPDAGFGYRNGFANNPSIGGNPAFAVPDIQAVMRRLRDADVVFSDAGTYAMTGYHQVYLYDPSYNLIEINQKVA